MPNQISKYITLNPKILGGKPIIRGTRISVEFILELLNSGMPFDEILKEHDHLKRAELDAVISFSKLL